MSDQRRVRFATIDGLAREDLGLAGEIWLDDVFRSPWASREAMKLAAHFVRYMADPNPSHLIVREIEREYQMVRDDVQRALMMLRTFGAVVAYAIDKDDIRVALNLSVLQRLRVLETSRRLRELTTTPDEPQRPLPKPVREKAWVPDRQPYSHQPADQVVAPLVAAISEHIRQSAAGAPVEPAARQGAASRAMPAASPQPQNGRLGMGTGAGLPSSQGPLAARPGCPAQPVTSSRVDA